MSNQQNQRQNQNQQPNQQQNQHQQIFEFLIKCFEMIQSGKPALIKQAEKKLEDQHQNPQFAPILMNLLLQKNVSTSIKFLISIYFKNYIKKYWGRDEEIIVQNDQLFIKKAIVPLMLQLDKNCQKMLSETISIISSYDFYAKWESLLPELIAKIKNETNYMNILGILKIIKSITKRYPNKDKNIAMINEIKYILSYCENIWLKMLQSWSADIIKLFNSNSVNSVPTNNQQQIKYQILCLNELILIFYDLNSVDLIEFFENNMSIWADIYKNLLNCSDKTSNNKQFESNLNLLRTSIVAALKLFNNKYEEEYSKYVPQFVEQICSLLTTIDNSESYDSLAAESIGYLSSVASQSWNCQLFNNASILNNIVQKILMRNISLRDIDINMYETNGEDWILRDIEGSDLYTRRRCAIDLIRSLLQHFNDQITQIILNEIKLLINKYSTNPIQNYIHKDTAINLILAISIKGQTKLLGATKINDKVPIMDFFSKYILPELTATKNTKSHPLIISDCLKFVVIFRSQWPNDNFLQLLPMACKYLIEDDYVLHTYAAIAIDKILAMKQVNSNNSNNNNNNNCMEYKYPKKLLISQIDKILISLFNVLNRDNENLTNEYIMKCIMRVISRCEEGCISVIGQVIKQISQLLIKISKNPQKPTFNHYLFECIAALIRFVCLNNNNNNNNNYISQFESVLMAPFIRILEMDNASEFHPYIYQIIGLMLRIRNKIDNNYSKLFDKLLETSLWNNDGNILAISSTFNDYLSILNKNDIKTFINDRRLTGMLGIYQHLLSKRTQDYYAFNVLKCIFQYIPHNKLNKYLKEIIELVCMRIRNKKSVALCCNFIVSLSVFIIINQNNSPNGFSILFNECNKIQSNIFVMILDKIWLKYCRNINDLIDRKIITVAMIIICNNNLFRNNNNLNKYYPQIINQIIEIFESTPLNNIKNDQKNTEYYIQKLEEQGSGNKYVKLSFARRANSEYDITKNCGDPRKLLIQCICNICGNNINNKNNFAKNLKPIIIKTINQYAKKFNINFNLPIYTNNNLPNQ